MKMMTNRQNIGPRGTWFSLAIILTGCTGVPDGLQTISGFEPDRYLGAWYEIARLDHRFERGLDQVTATYSRRDDGGIRVVNRGYNAETGEWSQAEGKAYLIGDDGQGRLKVSFFGPFYGGYNILYLADDYSVSVVTGPSRDYFWILSRTPTLPDTKLQPLLDKARNWDFDVDALIFPEQATNTAG